MSAGVDKERSQHAAGRIPGVDGLRACAAMLVLGYHAASFAGETSRGPFGLMASELKAGVTVFFVISGFLLYLPFARSISAGRGLPSWRDYGAKRAVRILPGYWVALAVLALAGQASGVSVVSAWRYLGLIQIYRSSTLEGGVPVAWSLCVEGTFYLALPLLAWAVAEMARRSVRSSFQPQVLLIASLMVGSLLLRETLSRSLVAPVGSDQLVLATALPGTIDWFALGMGLSVLRVAIELGVWTPRGLVELASRPGICWLIAGMLYLAAAPAQGGEVFLTTYGLAVHLAIGLAAALVVLPVVPPTRGLPDRFVTRFLCSGLLVWLGTISYGIYLWHVSFLQVFDGAVGRPRGVIAFVGLFAVTAAGAVALGAASWYLVERPAHRLHARGAIRFFAHSKLAGEAAS